MTERTEPGAPPCVLVVADEAVSGHFIAHALRAAGLAVQVAEDVAAAAAAIDRGGFDLVVAGALALKAGLGAVLARASRPVVIAEVPGASAPTPVPAGLIAMRLSPPLDAGSLLVAVRAAATGAPEVAEVARHLERFKERREFVAKLTRSFLGECPGRREALARVVGAGSCELAAAEAHGLVSTALAMGSERLAALARALETAARENRGADLAALLADLDAALARVEAYVRSVPPGENGQP